MTIIDADAILARATPAVHQEGHEIQPFNHVVKMPIALAHATCVESVENLNQLLADTITLRDLYKKHHWSRTMARLAAKSGDDGSNDVFVSEVIRRNELQVWCVSEHVVHMPLTDAR